MLLFYVSKEWLKNDRDHGNSSIIKNVYNYFTIFNYLLYVSLHIKNSHFKLKVSYIYGYILGVWIILNLSKIV